MPAAAPLPEAWRLPQNGASQGHIAKQEQRPAYKVAHDVGFGKNDGMRRPHQYARIERERRFLLRNFPRAEVVRVRRITDRYIDGTRLRLREQADDGGTATFKLTQKVPARANGAQQRLITNLYLTEDEFRLLSQLRARILRKTRYSVPPFGVDIFEGGLEGLRLAEAEFDSAPEADALVIPDFILHEVTGDERFTGGQLAGASRASVEHWLAEYGMTLSLRSALDSNSAPVTP